VCNCKGGRERVQKCGLGGREWVCTIGIDNVLLFIVLFAVFFLFLFLLVFIYFIFIILRRRSGRARV
jgi:Signal transduction histidine kinase involved in nitrogen fixation and metabolism regulation